MFESECHLKMHY